MVLAAPRGAVRVRERHLTAVDGGGGALAERLAAAEAAAAGPRKRVSDLEAELAVAVEAEDFGTAVELQRQLEPAREEMALAEVDVRVISEVQGAAEEARQAGQRAVQEAQRRAQAQDMLNGALVAQGDARDATAAALAVMRSNLLAARAAYDEARRAETGVGTAQRQEIQARRLLGEYGSDPGPLAPGANTAEALAGRDPLVRELARWRP